MDDVINKSSQGSYLQVKVAVEKLYLAAKYILEKVTTEKAREQNRKFRSQSSHYSLAF